MNKLEKFKDVITKQKNRVNMKLCSNDFGKGYCMGILSAFTPDDMSEDEYNELAKFIDDIFDEEMQDTISDPELF